MAKNKLSSISQADFLEKMGEFWDTHDFTEFDDLNIPDGEFEISCAVPIELNLISTMEKQAQRRGIKAENLVKLWLQQKLAEETESALAEKNENLHLLQIEFHNMNCSIQ